MARSQQSIQQEILDRIKEDERLKDLTSTSKTAIYRLMAYVVSYAIWLLEKLFDTHKEEVTNALYEQKSGSLRWYRQKALDFQYGFELLPGTDRFNDEGATAQEIAQSKIVKYAAVTESESESRLIIKIAGEKQDKLTPLDSSQTRRFKAYIKQIRYAGTPVSVISFLPDRLYLTLDLYRDPLVMDEKGVIIRTGKKPVEAAIGRFLKELPFNGELIIQNLVDCLQQLKGVRIVNVLKVERSWIEGVAEAYGAKHPVEVSALAKSGYFQLADFEGINYVVQGSDR